MIKMFLKIIRIFLIVFTLISIVFHIGFVLELAINSKYEVYWLSPVVFNSYYLYLNIHILFLLILIADLIFEHTGGTRKHESNPSYNDSDASKEKKDDTTCT